MRINFAKIDLSDYSTTEEVEEMIEEAISGIDLSNYWTSAETQEAIDEAISEIDLSAYWTSAETQEAIDEAISEIDLTDIEEDIATISGKVQTDEEVISTALNEIHDSLDNFVSSGQVETMIDAAISGIDLSNYYTSAQTQEAIDAAISGIDLSNYWTSAETQEAIDEAISEIDLTDIENDIATISGKVQTDEEVISTALNEIHDSLDNFVSSGQVETMIDAAISGIDLSNYYTSAQTQEAIDAAISGIDLSNYYTSAETQSAIDEGVGAVSDRLDDVERVTSIALNELHDSMNGMVSGNGITSIVGISQSDYADLVSGGTVDNNCLYAIIENN